MYRVAIYCRLSDEDKDKNNKFEESESIQNQKTLLMKYAIEKGWEVYNIYSDDDYSGLDINRPEFNKMIQDAKKGKFDIILCKHQSRFSRDVEIVEKYLHRLFPEWGIRFVSLTDHVDTLDEANKKSRQINSLVNEWYSEDISKAIRATFKIKREEGKFIGSFAPYGYIKDPKDKNRIIIDDKAARVVRMVFDWYLKGYGTQHIAHMLNERGIPNPTRYKQNMGLRYKNSSQTDAYGLWNKTTIRRILRNEVYIGNIVQGKREKPSYKSKRIISKNKDDWIKVKNTHEPIIDDETFVEVQKKFNRKARSTGKGKVHIFAGKVKCADCMSSMNKVKSGKYEYLRCKLYLRAPKKGLCTSHSIRIDKLEKVVIEKIKKYFEKVNEEYIANKLHEDNDLYHEKESLKKEVEEIDRELKEKNYVIKNLYIDKVKGIISESQFYELNNKFNNDIKMLQNRRVQILREIEEIIKVSNNIKGWETIMSKYKNLKKLTHTIVNQLIDHIEVEERNKEKGQQKIKIFWKF